MGHRRLILNSKGLNTEIGSGQIKEEITSIIGEDLTNKSIYIVSYPEYEVDEKILLNCITILGISKENIRFSENNMPDYEFRPDFIYVTEGNTFEILNYMRKHGICEYIKELMNQKDKDVIYIGSSAGAAIAGSDIMLARDFDRNFVGMIDFTALGLFNGTIVPHYTKEELERYIMCTEEHILNRYPVIYSVSNEEILDIEIDDWIEFCRKSSLYKL